MKLTISETSFLVIFGPNFGHETTNFEQNFENFLKKKKLVETTSGFNETSQMTEVVSKKLVKIQNTIENQHFERQNMFFKNLIFY